MCDCKFLVGYSGETEFEVDQAMFESVVKAKGQLKLLFRYEDTYKLLSDSVYEFELHLLKLGLRYQLGRANTEGYEDFFDEARQTISLKLISLFTSGRIFIERATSILKSLGMEDFAGEVFSEEFDQNFQYRLGEALRNHSLHRSLPLSRNVFSRKSLHEEERFTVGTPVRDRFTVNPQISVEEFTSSDKIRGKTKEEVEALGVKYLDLKFIVRGYVAGLARCHQKLRVGTEAAIEKSIGDIEKLVEHCKQDGEEEAFLYIGSCNSGKWKNSKIEICPKRLRRIKELRFEKDTMSKLSVTFLSSEISKRKDSYPKSNDKLWISE
ncbi:MAG: hypothetical protein JXR15_12685 [Shimia sp.]|uniref:hypothetical protein n=1 Tax=Shimia sp. TaxID=1954381 RepID=UPI003B8B35E8